MAASTTTSVTSSPNPSAVNQIVQFVVTVLATGNGHPTGTATLKDGGTTIGSTALSATGVAFQSQATFNISSLAAGSHSITASYTTSNGATFTSSNTAGPLIQVVNAGSSGGNNVGGSLHQSTQYITGQITSSSTTSSTDAVDNGIDGQFGGGGGVGSLGGGSVTASIPPDTGQHGLTGYSVSRGQALTMLAQAAQSIMSQSDAAGGLPRIGDGKEQVALGPSSLSFGSNRPYGAFVVGSYSGIGSNQAGGQFSGNVQTYTAGADYKFTPNLLAGLALSYENSTVHTSYNAGSLKDTGVTVMPYVAWHQDNLRWDAMLGGGSLAYHIQQNTGTPATGRYSAQRVSFKTNFTADYFAAGFRLSPTIGLLSAFEFDNGYIDSTGTAQSSSSVRILRPSTGGEVGYDWLVPSTSLLLGPYGKALVQYDLLHSGRATLTNGTLASETTASGVLGGGLRARITEYLSAAIEGTYNTVGATNISQWVATGQVRLDLPF